jgi:hypothetical protein
MCNFNILEKTQFYKFCDVVKKDDAVKKHKFSNLVQLQHFEVKLTQVRNKDNIFISRKIVNP